MYDYTQLDALSAVLKTGSFDGAASQLGVTQSAISQRIKQLEDRVGTVLVKRGQPCTATHAGTKLVNHTDTVRLMEQAVQAEIAPTAQHGQTPLRIAVNADSLAVWFLPALAAQDQFLYDLVIDDQDHSADWLRAGEVVAAVTGHADPVQGCDSHPLGALRYQATASPEFLEKHMPDGPTEQALARAPALSFNAKDRLQTNWAAQVLDRKIALPCHRIATTEGFLDAARLGIGWGMNPDHMIAADLREGTLALLAADAPLDVPHYWQVSRVAKAPLAKLTQHVIAQANKHAVPGSYE